MAAFITFGDIIGIHIPTPTGQDSKESSSIRLFAYVQFEDAADAREAIGTVAPTLALLPPLSPPFTCQQTSVIPLLTHGTLPLS